MNRLQRIAGSVRRLFERDMSRADRARWASASSLADIGHLTVEWLYGGITQTPGHGGPPDPETLPHLDVLAACNRAGFVTTNSQSAITAAEAEEHGWRECEAWVTGFASDATLAGLRAGVAGTPLLITWNRRRESGGGADRWERMARREVASFYADRCPDAAGEIRGAWWVTITDPEPGRNTELWPALAAFAGESG